MKPFIPSKVAETIFALVFVYFAYLHFTGAAMMAAAVPEFFPGDGKIWVYLAAVAYILAAIAIITGIQKTLACYLLALLLIIFILTMHVRNIDAKLSDVLKDLGLAMGAILIGNRGSK